MRQHRISVDHEVSRREEFGSSGALHQHLRAPVGSTAAIAIDQCIMEQKESVGKEKLMAEVQVIELAP